MQTAAAIIKDSVLQFLATQQHCAIADLLAEIERGTSPIAEQFHSLMDTTTTSVMLIATTTKH